jgi:hypothetical protein
MRTSERNGQGATLQGLVHGTHRSADRILAT